MQVTPLQQSPVHPSRRLPPRGKAGGFTLVEVLIAIVIVAIGLLGLPALQLVTLKSADSARYRSIAVALTVDMADRLRANSAGAVLGVSVDNGYNRPRATRAEAAYNSPRPQCRSAGCLPADMVLDDLANWQSRIARTLPGGIGVVCIDSGSQGEPRFNGTTLTPRCDGLGGAYAIKILWLDDRGETARAATTNEAYASFVTRVNPTF